MGTNGPQRPRPLWGPQDGRAEPAWTTPHCTHKLAAASLTLPFFPILPLCQLLFVPHTRLNISKQGPCPQSPSPRAHTASCLQPAAGFVRSLPQAGGVWAQA